MFVSLNKKIIYSIIFLFILTSLIFVYTFYIVYGNKIQEEQHYNIQRNQHYVDLLLKNTILTKELRALSSQNKDINISANVKQYLSETEASKSLPGIKQIQEVNDSFDKRYTAIRESLKLLAASAVLIILSIILLGYLISRWILLPLNRITAVAAKVSGGTLSARIKRERQPRFTDEMDFLITTFNLMLDNLQDVIREVKDKEAFLQSLIDSIPDGIRVIDRNYNIIIANKAYYRQTASAPSAAAKCYASSQKLSSPCESRQNNCPVREILSRRQKSMKVIQQFQAAPNRFLSINAAPLSHNGKEKFIVESIRDLSDDINYSHQQKLSSLGFLSTSIAHEMKNQLGALRIIMEHLIGKHYSGLPDDNEQKKQITLVYNELLNCISIPERLLNLTRSSQSEEQPVNCAASLRDVIAIMDFEAKSKGISVELKCAADIFIRGNEADFKMVAINLILNAIKAMSPGGLLQIETACSSGSVNISFRDNGCGISPENLPHIFSPFFSEGKLGSDKGSGLGLSISKSIVEKFGGTIGVSSSLGTGSCFSLSFPAIKNLAK